MGAYVGNYEDKAAKLERVYVGAHDLASHVYKIYMGNEWGEAELVWVDEEYMNQLEKEERERDAR